MAVEVVGGAVACKDNEPPDCNISAVSLTLTRALGNPPEINQTPTDHQSKTLAKTLDKTFLIEVYLSWFTEGQAPAQDGHATGTRTRQCLD